MAKLSWTLAGMALSALVSTAANSQDTIKIGINQPLTGPFAASGNYIIEGAKIAAEEINADGGILGKQVELIIEDNKSNPTEAAAVAEKLITRDEVPVMMGAWGSSLTLAAMPKIMQYEVPMLVETSSSSKITQQGNPWIFRISPPSWVEAELFSKSLPDLDIQKVDFLSINNDWGLGAQKDFGAMFEENGIEVGLLETMDQASQDMSAQLSKIKGTDSDAVIVTAAVEQLTLILKQAEALGLEKQIITTGGSQNPDQLVDQAGAAADGTIHLVFFAPWFPEEAPNPEQAASFVEAWAEAGHDKAGLTESYRGHDGVYVIKAAIEKAGAAEPDAIRQAFWEIEVPVINGTVTFQKDGPDGQESGQYMANGTLIRIEGGEIQPAFGS